MESKIEEIRKGKPKGLPKTGGRLAGVPNKVTQEFRETVRQLLEDNKDNVSVWLTQVASGTEDAKPDPKGALDMITKLAEFAAPKLARTELAGDKENPIIVQTVNF
jgi:hypothetical protein